MTLRVFFLILFASCFLTGAFLSNGQMGFKGKKIEAKRLTDNDTFLDFCKKAVSDQEVFYQFKRHPIYKLFHETSSYEQGKEALEVVAEQTPELLERGLLERIRRIDCVGAPLAYSFADVGPFSASTIIYLKTASDLKHYFGPMKELRVIEIGGNNGGLCKVLHEVFDIEHYTIVNNGPSAELAKKHLDALGIDHVQFVPPDKLNFEASDFLLSNI